MIEERRLLSLLASSRLHYEGLSKFISSEDFVGAGAAVFDSIAAFYRVDPTATVCDKGLLGASVARANGRIKELVAEVVDGLDMELSSPNIVKEYVGYKKDIIGQELSIALLNHEEDRVSQLMSEYHRFQSMEEDGIEQEELEVYQGAGFDSFVEKLEKKNLIHLNPKNLNDALGGGVPPQTHVLIYALPEAGKSLAAINIAAGCCHEGHKVLYIGNEDPAYAMLMRFSSRFTLMGKEDIMKNVASAEKKARDNGYDNLIFAPMAPGTFWEIEDLIQRHQPAVLVVDQLRHIHVKGADGEPQQLAAAGKEMRRFAKKYNLVSISVHQAGDSASGRLYLDMGDVYMSNTSLPGDADVMIGIGANEDYMARGLRMLNLPKNKINGNHNPVQVAIQPQYSRMVQP